VGAVEVEGAPTHPNSNQIVNASKLQLGELYTQEKLQRALENVRQLMQENGYYRARVTAESVSNPANQQVNILFHISRGEQRARGRVKVTGTSGMSSLEVQDIAHLNRGDRVTAERVRSSLQRCARNFRSKIAHWRRPPLRSSYPTQKRIGSISRSSSIRVRWW